jgi:hypothetical protein
MEITQPIATKATFTRLYQTQIGHLSSKNSDSGDVPKHRSGEILFGHSQHFDQNPSSKDLDSYKSGQSHNLPIRIVTYRKQGVPLPRTASGQTHRGQCRNGSGGFYSA